MLIDEFAPFKHWMNIAINWFLMYYNNKKRNILNRVKDQRIKGQCVKNQCIKDQCIKDQCVKDQSKLGSSTSRIYLHTSDNWCLTQFECVKSYIRWVTPRSVYFDIKCIIIISIKWVIPSQEGSVPS